MRCGASLSFRLSGDHMNSILRVVNDSNASRCLKLLCDEGADSAVCVNVFEDLATCFGELSGEFLGVVIDLKAFRTDSMGETFCELCCGFSKARLWCWRR